VGRVDRGWWALKRHERRSRVPAGERCGERWRSGEVRGAIVVRGRVSPEGFRKRGSLAVRLEERERGRDGKDGVPGR